MKIKDVFEAMQAADMTRSQMEFSRIWLGRSPRYFSHLVAAGREPGIATLCGLLWRLQRMELQQRPTLQDLERKLVVHINRRAITDIRRHRS